MNRRSLTMRAIASAVLFTLTYTPILGSLTGTLAAAQTAQNTTTRYQYDANGNLTHITDPLGHVTNQSYDALNRLKQQLQPAPATGAARPAIGYTYDGQDRLATVVDPRNLTTTYTTDGLGNQTALTSPDTGTTTNTYDAAGNLKTRKDARGLTTTYTYDVLNRVTQIAYASGTATQFDYDGGTAGAPHAKGQLTKITDESGQTTYAYGPFSRLRTKVQTVGTGTAARSFTVTYRYGTSGSRTGALTSIIYPSGNRINATYDSAGRINRLTLNPANANGQGTDTDTSIPLLTGIGYQPFGPVRSWTWGNSSATAGNTYARGIDLDGRITSYPLGNGIANGTHRTVAYDAASRIGATTHSGTGTGSNAPANLNQSFQYDNLDRLTSAVAATTSQGYHYDQNGNRTQLAIGGNSYPNTIAAGSNRLSTTTGPAPAKTMTYDAMGNMRSDGTASYTYSDRGRLQSVTTAAGTVTYLYNGLGQRVRKSGPASLVPSGRIDYVYDEQGHLLGEYDANGKVLQETAYLNDMPVAILPTGTSSNFIIADNSAPAPSVVGTWSTSSSVAGYYGSDYRVHDPASNSDSFSWKLPLPTASTYHIYARWTSASKRAGDAPYTITHASGSNTVKVDQRSNNNTWMLLGTYAFDSAEAHVKLGVSGTGYVIADAVMAMPATVAVADNSDPSRSVVGAWSTSSSVAGYYGSDYRVHDPASNSDRFSWKLALPTAGAYNLYARWTSASKRASDAPYTITHASGSKTVKVDQRSNNNSWMPLGTYTFNSAEANVKLGVSGTGYVIADAVMAVSSAPATVAATATSGTGTQVHYVYADHVNTPRVITRASDNKMVWRWDNADAFGMIQPNENPSGLGVFVYNPRFPGQLYDKETNFHYNYFRYYDPSTGRYVESDPIGLDGGINTYAYVESNPIVFYDPTGLQIAVPVTPPPPPAGGGSNDGVNGGTPGYNPVTDMPTSIPPSGPSYTPIPASICFVAPAICAIIITANKPPKDAHDPNGSKAPGKPGDAEGFCEPKKGPKWGKSPNGRGSGWIDNDGNVWVPTGWGSDAHGGPHWDVQKPNGGYENVYPGGKRR